MQAATNSRAALVAIAGGSSVIAGMMYASYCREQKIRANVSKNHLWQALQSVSFLSVSCTYSVYLASLETGMDGPWHRWFRDFWATGTDRLLLFHFAYRGRTAPHSGRAAFTYRATGIMGICQTSAASLSDSVFVFAFMLLVLPGAQVHVRDDGASSGFDDSAGLKTACKSRGARRAASEHAPQGWLGDPGLDMWPPAEFQ